MTGEARSSERSILRYMRHRPAGLAMTWVIAATCLQLLRSTGPPVWDTVWAEDGHYFLSGALESSWGSIFVPLAGYLQVPSRLMGILAASLPLEWASEVFAVGSALIVSLVSVYVFAAARTLIRSSVARTLIAGMIPLLPISAIESTANAANLQYFLLFACFWALVHPAKGRLQTFAGCAVVIGAALGSVFAWLYLPLAVFQWRRTSGSGRVVLACYGAAAAVQAIAVFIAVVLERDPTLAQYPLQWANSDPSEFPGIYGLRVVGGLLFGTRLISSAWSFFGWFFVAIAAVSVTLLLFQGLRRKDTSRAWIVVASLLSVATFALPVLLRGTAHLATEGSDVQVAGARYTLLPIWFLLSALALVLWGHAAVASRRWAKVVRAALLLLAAFTVVLSFRVATFRSNGPLWSTELEAARMRCEALQIDTVSIPITPYEAWKVTTTCETLRR